MSLLTPIYYLTPTQTLRIIMYLKKINVYFKRELYMIKYYNELIINYCITMLLCTTAILYYVGININIFGLLVHNIFFKT